MRSEQIYISRPLVCKGEMVGDKMHVIDFSSGKVGMFKSMVVSGVPWLLGF